MQAKRRESSLYPRVRTWLLKEFRCFDTAIGKGTRYSRPDVFGVRDVGGDFSGEVESIVIEVKRGSEPFATASGQARGYSVMANRVYLADQRVGGFTNLEKQIASNLGIGLIQIHKTRGCREVLSSPHHIPITRLWLEMLWRIGWGRCQICGTFVQSATGTEVNEDVKKAVTQGKGLRFWNEELAERKKKLGMARKKEDADDSYQRRIVCADCIWALFSKLIPSG
jgi:hypothetical protein